MEILIIDLGAYAVKFLEVHMNRKEPAIMAHHQVFLERVRPQLAEDLTIEEIHQQTIQRYLSNNPFEGKIIYQLPEYLVTSRFLTLPIGNRRKAEMMIPFQLDENLPFPAGQIHTTTSISRVSAQETKALVTITQKETFDAIYESLRVHEIVPAVLTSELGIVHSFADAAEIAGPIALVDIGHESTKCYFIFNKQVVSNHLNFTAGSAVNEMLQTTYELDQDDASVYKHENAFFLTEDQYPTVSEDQAYFARLMKEVFQPLIHDLKRWEVGFRVKYGHPIDKMYLMGGSSQIKNFAPFLTEALGIEVEVYNPYSLCTCSTEPLKKPDQAAFALASMTAYAHKGKVVLPNFLHGAYRSSYSTNIPPQSTMFLFARLAILCLLLSAGLLVERYLFIAKEDQLITRQLGQEPFSNTERNLFRRSPDRLLTQLKTRTREQVQEVQLIQSAARTDALLPLTQLSGLLSSNQKVDLVLFRSMGQDVEAQFKSDDLEELETLSAHLLNLGLPGVFVEVDDNEKVLNLSFRGRSD